MAGASKSGGRYESSLAENLSNCSYNGIPVIVGKLGGSNKNATDIPAIISLGPLHIEAKTKNAFEGGSSKFRIENGVYIVPDNPIIARYIPKGYQPFNGFIPSFLLGDTKNSTLEKERIEQKKLGNPLDTTLVIQDTNAVADYYASKGVHYFHWEDLGLYHTGNDIYNFGVPLLEMKLGIRIRCKPHKTNKSYSVQAQIKIIKKPIQSLYDFDDSDKLPPGFTVSV